MENVLPSNHCYVRYKSRGLHPLNGYVWKFLWLYRFQPDFGTHHPDYMYYPLIVPLCINLCINVNVNRWLMISIHILFVIKLHEHFGLIIKSKNKIYNDCKIIRRYILACYSNGLMAYTCNNDNKPFLYSTYHIQREVSMCLKEGKTKEKRQEWGQWGS